MTAITITTCLDYHGSSQNKTHVVRYHYPEQPNELSEKTSTVRTCLALPARSRDHVAVAVPATSVGIGISGHGEVSFARMLQQVVICVKPGHKEWQFFTKYESVSGGQADSWWCMCVCWRGLSSQWVIITKSSATQYCSALCIWRTSCYICNLLSTRTCARTRGQTQRRGRKLIHIRYILFSNLLSCEIPDQHTQHYCLLQEM